MSEQEMISGAQQGNEQAFTLLYEKYHKNVYYQVLKMVHDASVAEDVTQDVFLKVHQRIGTFRGDSQFGTWLYTVAMNTGRMYLRNRRNKPQISLEGMEEEKGNGNHRSEASSLDRGLIEASFTPDYDTHLDIQRALDTMGGAKGQRDLLDLYAYEGYEMSELATMAGITIGAVKSQLHKARAKVRQVMCA